MFNFLRSKRSKLAAEFDALIQEHGTPQADLKLFDLTQRQISDLKSLGSSDKILEKITQHLAGLLRTPSEFKKLYTTDPDRAMKSVTGLIKEVQRATGGVVRGLPYAIAPRVMLKARDMVKDKGDPDALQKQEVAQRYELAQKPGTSSTDHMDPATALDAKDITPEELSLFGLTTGELTYAMTTKRMNDAIRYLHGVREKVVGGETQREEFRNEGTAKMTDDDLAAYTYKLMAILRNIKIIAENDSSTGYQIPGHEWKELGFSLKETQRLAEGWLTDMDKGKTKKTFDIKTVYGHAGTALQSIENLQKYLLQDSAQNAIQLVSDYDLEGGLEKILEFATKDRDLDMQLFSDTIKDIKTSIDQLGLSPIEKKYIYEIFDSQGLLVKDPKTVLSEAVAELKQFQRVYQDIMRSDDPEVIRKNFNEVMKEYRTYIVPETAKKFEVDKKDPVAEYDKAIEGLYIPDERVKDEIVSRVTSLKGSPDESQAKMDGIFAEIRSVIDKTVDREEAKKIFTSLENLKKTFAGYKKHWIENSSKGQEKTAALTEKELDKSRVQETLNRMFLEMKEKVTAFKSLEEREKRGELKGIYSKAHDFYNYYRDLKDTYEKQLKLPAIEKLRYLFKEVSKDFKTLTEDIKTKGVWDGQWMYKEEGKDQIEGAPIEEKTNDKGETKKDYFSLFDVKIGKDLLTAKDFLTSSKFMDYLKKKLYSISRPGLPQVSGPGYADIDRIKGMLDKVGEAIDTYNPEKMLKTLQDKLLKNVQLTEKMKDMDVKKEKSVQKSEQKAKEKAEKSQKAAPPAPAAEPTVPPIVKVAYVEVAKYLRKLASSMIDGGDVPVLDQKKMHRERQVGKKQPSWQRYQKRQRPQGQDTTLTGFFMEPDMVDEFINAIENDHFNFMNSMSEPGGPQGDVPLVDDPKSPGGLPALDYAKMKEMDQGGLSKERRGQYDPGLDEVISKVILKGKKNLREHVLENGTHMLKDMKRKISRVLSEYTDADHNAKRIAGDLEALNTQDNYKGRLTALAKFINAPEQEIQSILDNDDDLLEFYEGEVVGLSEKDKSKLRSDKGRELSEKKVYEERFTLKRRLMKYLEKYNPQGDKEGIEEKRSKALKRIQLLQKELKGFIDSGKDFDAMNQEIKDLDSKIDAMKTDASNKGVGYETIPGYNEAEAKVKELRDSVKAYNNTKLGLESANQDLTNLGRPGKDVSNEEYQKAVDILHKSMADSELISKILNDVNLSQIEDKRFQDYLKGQEALISKDTMKKFFNVTSWRAEKDNVERQLKYNKLQLEKDEKDFAEIKAEVNQITDEKEKEESAKAVNKVESAVNRTKSNIQSLEKYLYFLDKELKKYEGEVAEREPEIIKEINKFLDAPVYNQTTYRDIEKKLGLSKITDAKTLHDSTGAIGEAATLIRSNADKIDTFHQHLTTLILRIRNAPISKETFENYNRKLLDKQRQVQIMKNELNKDYAKLKSEVSRIAEKLPPAEKQNYKNILNNVFLPIPVSKPYTPGEAPAAIAPEMAKEADTGEPKGEKEDPQVSTPAKYFEKVPEVKVLDWDIIETLFENDQDTLRGYQDVLRGDKPVEKIQEVAREVSKLTQRLDKMGKLKDLAVTINDKPIKVSEVGKEFNKLFSEYTTKKNALMMKQNDMMMKKADLKFQLTELINLIGLDPKEIMDKASAEVKALKDVNPDKPVNMTEVLDNQIQSEKEPGFQGFTEKEIESIEDQFFRDLFWVLMKRWGDKIGQNVVFGEKTKPEFSMIYDTFKNLTGVKSNSILSGVINTASESRRMLKELKKKLSSMERAFKGTKHDVKETSEYKDTLNRVEHLKKLVAQKKAMHKIIDTQVDADGKIKVLEKIKAKTNDKGLISLIDKKIKVYQDQADAIAKENAMAAEEEGKKLTEEVGLLGITRSPVEETVPTPAEQSAPGAVKVAYDKTHRDFNLNILYGSYMQSKIAEMMMSQQQ